MVSLCKRLGDLARFPAPIAKACRTLPALATGAVLLATSGCHVSERLARLGTPDALEASAAATPRPGTLQIVATSSVLASMAQKIGGRYVVAQSLVPTGAGPETFEPSPREGMLLHNAQLLIENGGGYETWLAKLLQNADNPRLHTVVASLGVKKIGADPHLWMDPVRGRVYARRIRNAMIALDPDHAEEYRKNGQLYEHTLRALQKKIYKTLKAIPVKKCVFVATHNSWGYYTQRFGLKTAGVLESAPGREPDPARIARVVRAARTLGARVVIQEAQENPRLAAAVAAELPGGRVVPLYVDTLRPGVEGDDYREMLWYDTVTLAAALKATESAPPPLPKKARALETAPRETSPDDAGDADMNEVQGR